MYSKFSNSILLFSFFFLILLWKLMAHIHSYSYHLRFPTLLFIFSHILLWKLMACVHSYSYLFLSRQIGVNNYGLFTIAFATALRTSHDPSSIIYYWEVTWKKCLIKKKITPFPREQIIVRLFKGHTQRHYPSFASACWLPNDGKTMIMCSNCKNWFHGKCVSLLKSVK